MSSPVLIFHREGDWYLLTFALNLSELNPTVLNIRIYLFLLGMHVVLVYILVAVSVYGMYGSWLVCLCRLLVPVCCQWLQFM